MRRTAILTTAALVCVGVAAMSCSDDELTELTGTGTISITTEPENVAFPWTLTGPGGTSGNGNVELKNMMIGQYTIEWGSHPGWQLPVQSIQEKPLTKDSHIEFNGKYIALPIPRSLALSTNLPVSATITAFPADTTGTASGATPFVLWYLPGTDVTLTAPQVPTYDFSRWVVNGEPQSTTLVTQITVMDNMFARAEYSGAPQPSAKVLSVSTNLPNSITIGIAPADTAGAGSGATPLSRWYLPGTVVTLTAPTVPLYNFTRWVVNGSAHSTSLSAQIQISDTGSSARAEYSSVPYYTLSFRSNQPAATFTVSPADKEGRTNARVDDVFSYPANTTVRVTAVDKCAIVGVPGGATGSFHHWCPDLSTNGLRTESMSKNREVYAMYPEYATLSPADITGTVAQRDLRYLRYAGDKEFGGNGPRVKVTKAAWSIPSPGSELWFTFTSYAEEYKGGGVYGDSKGRVYNYTKKWPMASGYQAISVLGATSWTDDLLYIDKNHDLDCSGSTFTTSLPYWLNKICVNGDTGGDDLSDPGDDPHPDRSYVTLDFGTVRYLRVKLGCP